MFQRGRYWGGVICKKMAFPPLEIFSKMLYHPDMRKALKSNHRLTLTNTLVCDFKSLSWQKWEKE